MDIYLYIVGAFLMWFLCEEINSGEARPLMLFVCVVFWPIAVPMLILWWICEEMVDWLYR